MKIYGNMQNEYKGEFQEKDYSKEYDNDGVNYGIYDIGNELDSWWITKDQLSNASRYLNNYNLSVQSALIEREQRRFNILFHD